MTIVFSEIDATSPLPGVFAEFDLTSGALGKADRLRKLYVLASRLSTGTMVDNEVGTEPLRDWTDAQTRWGAGAEGAYGVSVILRTPGGPRVPVYPVALPDAGGAKAVEEFTASGTVGAGEGGYATIRIGEIVFTVEIAAGNTPQNTTDALLAGWNKVQTWLKPPVTCTSIINGAGPDYDLKVEANNTGAHWNALQLEVVEFTAGTQTLVAGGATLSAGSGSVDLSTVLPKLNAIRTHYICFSDFIEGTTTTGLKALKDHIIAKSDGNSMLGGYVFAGFAGTLSAATALVAAVDSNDAERMALAWEEESKSHPFAMAASLATQQAALVDPTRALNDKIHPALSAQKPAKRPTDASCKTALNGGVTPLRTDLDDETTVKTVRLVAMRTDLETPFDISSLETLDEFRDRFVARARVRFAGYKIVASDDDPAAEADKVTTPTGVLFVAFEVALEMQSEGKMQNIAGLADQAKAEFVAGGGCALQFPVEWVPNLHKIMAKIQAVYPA